MRSKPLCFFAQCICGAGGEPRMSVQAAITAILSERTPRQTALSGFRRAAVLIPLYETSAGLHVLLTKRTELVPTHKGQISFPGGGFLETDGDLQQTALRESAEEIGLASEDVRVVGVLDDTPSTASGYLVRPFVGFIPHPYPFRLDGFEIDRVIALPLLPLMRHGKFREEIWDRGGTPHHIYFYQHGEDTIWGLTARILRDLVQILAGPLCAGGYLTLTE